jgi:hypothetical protein
MLGSDPVAMRRIVLPSSLSDAHVFDRTCVFLIDEPWAVAAWSLEGVEFWRQEMPFSTVATRPRLGLDARGEVWVSSGQLLFTPASGETIDAGANIFQFTCTDDGFLLALEADPLSIVRIRRDAREVWRTDVAPPDQIGYAGIVQWEASTGFRPHQMPPWRPRSWDMRLVKDPIVVGIRLAVVGAGDDASGLSCRYALALDSGEVAWSTEPAPWSHVTSIGNNWFLGQQGYGAYKLQRRLEDGTVVDTWPVDGYVSSLLSGSIHVIEMENMLPSETHASALMKGGVVKRGPHLDEYYTSRPALTADGELIFWRNDELQVVDAELRRRTLARVPSQEGSYFPSDMHLDAAGTLAFTLGNVLWTAESRFRPFRGE